MTFAPRTWVVGEVVTAATLNQEIRDQINSMLAAWTSYTPTWTAATSNPVLGAGTLLGRYMKIGRTVLYHINLVTAADTTYGSGAYSFALPATSANVGCSYVGSSHLLAGTRWGGQNIVGPNVATTSPFFPTNSTTTTLSQQTPTVPATLASGHQVRMTGTYEAAA